MAATTQVRLLVWPFVYTHIHTGHQPTEFIKWWVPLRLCKPALLSRQSARLLTLWSWVRAPRWVCSQHWANAWQAEHAARPLSHVCGRLLDREDKAGQLSVPALGVPAALGLCMALHGALLQTASCASVRAELTSPPSSVGRAQGS